MYMRSYVILRFTFLFRKYLGLSKTNQPNNQTTNQPLTLTPYLAKKQSTDRKIGIRAFIVQATTWGTSLLKISFWFILQLTLWLAHGTELLNYPAWQMAISKALSPLLQLLPTHSLG